jgi:sugar phosphate isomerase/epimerase
MPQLPPGASLARTDPSDTPETLSALRASGFDGFFSLEPHLASSGMYSGFSGPELFRKAAGAFKELLRRQDIEWA